MVGLVHNRHGASVHQGGDDAQVGLVACGEHQRGLHAQELRDLVLQPLVQVGGAVEEAGAGEGSAVLVDGVAGRLEDAGVTGQAEVVVGAQHDDAPAVDLGLGAVVTVQGLEEGIEPDGAGLFGELEALHLGEDVARITAVIAVVQHPLDGEAGEGGRVGLGVCFRFSLLGHKSSLVWEPESQLSTREYGLLVLRLPREKASRGRC